MISMKPNSSFRKALLSKATMAILLVTFATLSLHAKDEVPPQAVLSAKTVYVVARIGNVGAGKYKPDDKRAKSQVTKGLEKWGRYQVVDEPNKADLVLIITEGHSGTYGTSYGASGAMGGARGITTVAAPSVLSDTLAVYKGGAVDESTEPLWKATETGDDFDWPADRVIKKFRKAVEKASK